MPVDLRRGEQARHRGAHRDAGRPAAGERRLRPAAAGVPQPRAQRVSGDAERRTAAHRGARRAAAHGSQSSSKTPASASRPSISRASSICTSRRRSTAAASASRSSIARAAARRRDRSAVGARPRHDVPGAAARRRDRGGAGAAFAASKTGISAAKRAVLRHNLYAVRDRSSRRALAIADPRRERCGVLRVQARTPAPCPCSTLADARAARHAGSFPSSCRRLNPSRRR